MAFMNLLRRQLSSKPAKGVADLSGYRLGEGPFRIAAVGDIHGRADLLARMFDRLDARGSDGGGSIIEVYLGDYIDRGPDSSHVIDMLIRRKAERPHVQLLAGNHEEMLVGALEDASNLRPWAANGGLATLASYGVEADADDRSLQRELRKAVPASHLRFLAGLVPNFWYQHFFFAHAGVRPRVPLLAQDPIDLRWIREPFLSSGADFGAIVVHGHTPGTTPQFRANRICLDTGAFHTGRLTALVIGTDGADVVVASR